MTPWYIINSLFGYINSINNDNKLFVTDPQTHLILYPKLGPKQSNTMKQYIWLHVSDVGGGYKATQSQCIDGWLDKEGDK